MLMRFDLTLMGTSGAVPAYGRFPSMQLLNVQEHCYMIDCGEGAQMRFAGYGLSWGKVRQIFISHMHGDHFYGLPGLISAMGLNRRREPLTVYGPPGLQQMMEQVLPGSGKLSFELQFKAHDPSEHRLIYEDETVSVHTLPLRHSIPAAGFLFKEQPKARKMRGELIEKYGIPYQRIPAIKGGEGFRTASGEWLPHEELTEAPPPPRTYAYCSDTAYEEALLPWMEGVDLLYHEATFCELQRAQAEKTVHATAMDAARIARLAGAKQLVLGHYSSRYKYLDVLLAEACSIFPNTLLGCDGGVVSVPRADSASG